MRKVGMLLLAGMFLPGSSGAEEPAIAPKHDPTMPSAEISLVHATSSFNFETGDAQRTFIMQVDLTVPEGSPVVGLSQRLDLTQLKASDGTDLLAAWRETGQIVFGGPRHYGQVTMRHRGRSGGSIPLMTSLNRLPQLPSGFETIRGKTHVLYATRRVTRRFEPLSHGAMLELSPALVIQLESLNQEGRTVQLKFNFDSAQPTPFFNPNVVPPFVDSVVLLDDVGAEVSGHGGAPQPGEPRNGVYQGTAQLAFNLEPERKPQALEFNVVLEMEEREVEFIGRDIKMPIAGD